MQRFAFWPNGTFCPLEDVEEYLSFMPDDYEVKDFPNDGTALAYIDRVAFTDQFTNA